MMENNGKNGDILKTIINGGLVSVALAAIYIMWSMQKDFSKTLNNDVAHNTAVLIELKASIDQTNEINKTQIRAIEVQSKAIEGLTNAFINLRK